LKRKGRGAIIEEEHIESMFKKSGFGRVILGNWFVCPPIPWLL
jgi:hypothetical protein